MDVGSPDRSGYLRGDQVVSQHHRVMMEQNAGPAIKVVESLSSADPSKLAVFRREYDAIAADYFENNTIRQDYLMTRATKI